MNKATPVNSIRAKHWPEVGRLPNWNDESFLNAAKLHVPDHFARQINRGTKPVVMVRPILGESVHATRAVLIKSGIEALNFRIVRASKPITGMGNPQVVQCVKNCR